MEEAISVHQQLLQQRRLLQQRNQQHYQQQLLLQRHLHAAEGPLVPYPAGALPFSQSPLGLLNPYGGQPAAAAPPFNPYGGQPAAAAPPFFLGLNQSPLQYQSQLPPYQPQPQLPPFVHGGSSFAGAPRQEPTEDDDAVANQQLHASQLRNALYHEHVNKLRMLRAQQNGVMLRKQLSSVKEKAQQHWQEQQQQQQQKQQQQEEGAIGGESSSNQALTEQDVLGRRDPVLSLLLGKLDDIQSQLGSGEPPPNRAGDTSVKRGQQQLRNVAKLASTISKATAGAGGEEPDTAEEEQHAAGKMEPHAPGKAESAQPETPRFSLDSAVQSAMPLTAEMTESAPIEDQILGLGEEISGYMKGIKEDDDDDDEGEEHRENEGAAGIDDASQDKESKKIRSEKRAALRNRLMTHGVKSYRKPRWRLQEEGIFYPAEDKLLRGKAYLKAAVLAVIAVWTRPKLAMERRKERGLAKDKEDFNSTIGIYLDRSRRWIQRAVKVPISHLLNDNNIDLRVGREQAEVTAVGKIALLGHVQKRMDRQYAETRMLRLKVHTRAVVQGLTKEQLPDDISKFLVFLVADGNHFPEGFLFPSEVKKMEFDRFGCTRWMIDVIPEPVEDAKSVVEAHTIYDVLKDEQERLRKQRRSLLTGLGDKEWLSSKQEKLRPIYRSEQTDKIFNAERVEMLVLNFFVTRILIPELLYPWLGGQSKGKGVRQGTLAHNAQVLASVLYRLVRRLRPDLLPINDATLERDGQQDSLKKKKLSSVDTPANPARRRRSMDAAVAAANSLFNGIRGGTNKQEVVRSLEEVVRTERFFGNAQLIRGLLPDAYFEAIDATKLEWLEPLVVELDIWLQKIVLSIMKDVVAAAKFTRG